MRARLSGGARLLLALLCLGAAAAQPEYYPHQPGYSWTYDSGETQILSGPMPFAGTEVMVLTHYFHGEPISEDYLQYGADGVRTLGTAAAGTALEYAPPLVVYGPEPLELGSRWRSSTSVGGLEITLSAEVVAVKGVATRSGRYNAYQIRQVTVTSTGANTVIDLYFVPGVGVVRFVTQDGTVIDLMEKSF